MVAPDRALRRMIARLPALPVADLDAVLDSLDERQRMRVRGLLAELVGVPAAKRDSSERGQVDVAMLPPGLSPWLLDRLGVPLAGGAAIAPSAAMTSHAAATLRACACELAPMPTAAISASPFAALRRWFGTIDAKVRGI